MQFSIWKRAIFRKIKEINNLSGGVVLYAAQSNPQIDTEIAEIGRFRTKANYVVGICRNQARLLGQSDDFKSFHLSWLGEQLNFRYASSLSDYTGRSEKLKGTPWPGHC